MITVKYITNLLYKEKSKVKVTSFNLKMVNLPSNDIEIQKQKYFTFLNVLRYCLTLERELSCSSRDSDHLHMRIVELKEHLKQIYRRRFGTEMD